MTTRARKKGIIVALNTLGGRPVDESSLADGRFLRYDQTNDRYVHYDISNLDLWVPYTGATEDVDLGEYSVKTTSIKFNEQAPPIPEDRELYWDSIQQSLNLPINGKELNIGEETWVPLCYNNSGQTILDGEPVYIDGSFNDYPIIKKASNETYETSRVIGITTEDILNNTIGRVTRFGYVRDIDLSMFSPGDEIYLGIEGLTNVKQTGGYFDILIGKCITSGTTGKMLVYPRVSEETAEISRARGYASYTQGDQTNIAFNDGTRTFTISPVGSSFYYYQDGIKYIQTTTQSIVIPDITGLHYIYFDGYDLITVFAPTQMDIIDIIKNKVLTSVIYWNNITQSNLYVGNERHTFYWPSWLHYNLHSTRGTQYISGLSLNGFTIDNGSLNSHAQFGADSGAIDDEGILSTTDHIINTQGLPIYYRLGNPGTWTRTLRAGYSFLSGTIYAQYNLNTAGTWSLAELANNSYMLIHIFATSDIYSNKTIAITGTGQYDSLGSAEASVNNEIFSLYGTELPFVEFRHIATVIIECRNSFASSIKTRVVAPSSGGSYLDFRRSQVAGGTASGSTSQSFLGLSDTPVSYATHANKLVQVNALENGLNFSNTLNSDLTVNGVFYINGNIIQSGTNYETHAENVYTTKDYITLRDGAISGLAPGTYAGLRAKLYDGVNDGHLVFDNNGIARVGDVGSEQPLATRIENPTNNHIAYWESANTRLNFKSFSAGTDYEVPLSFSTGLDRTTNTVTLLLATNSVRGGIQIGYTATGANLPLLLSSEKGYITLSSTAIIAGLGYTPYNSTNPSGYTSNTGTVTSVGNGNGMNFTTFTTSGTVTLGTPSTLTGSTTNAVTTSSHTHAISLTAADVSALPISGGTMTGAITFAAGQTWPTFNQSTTGNAASATVLQTARSINGTSFNGSADVKTTEWIHSIRDFPNGTLITTAIDYSVTDGSPWVLEIRGNSYSNLIPLDLQVQGYIYGGTIINAGGYSNGTNISGLVALNVGGNLCFWFPNQGYWNGYNARAYVAYPGALNQITSITHTAKPAGTKEVALSSLIRQSLHSENWSSYAAAASHNHVKANITDFPASMPASDVYAWAKAASKPTYTNTEVGAAAASHGNHVPALQSANNAIFLRNDNTWQSVTPANIGAEPSFTKNTGFNKNFGTIAGTVSEGNHTHAAYLTAITKAMVEAVLIGDITSHSHSIYSLATHNHDGTYLTAITKAMVEAVLTGAITSHTHAYEPIFSKNTAFNKNFGTTAGTVCQGDDSRLSDARTPSDNSVTYAKLNSTLTSRQAVGASAIDWSLGGVYTKTLTAATTFTFSNLQLNKVITLVTSGNFTITLPAYCKRISGTYDGATTNYLQFHCTNATGGSEEVWFTISKQT